MQSRDPVGSDHDGTRLAPAQWFELEVRNRSVGHGVLRADAARDLAASADGTITGSFVLPESVAAGAHSVVLEGAEPDGSPATVRLALIVNHSSTSVVTGSSPSDQARTLAFTG